MHHAQAQEKWDLERCIRHAQKNNLQVIQSYLNQKAAETQQTQSIADLFPSLNANTSYNFNFGRSIDPTLYSFVNQQIQTSSLSMTSSVTLLNGLSKVNAIRGAKFDVLSSQFATEDIANIIALSVTQAFLQILLSSEEMKTAEQRLTLAADQVEQTRKMLDAGVVPEGNYYDVLAQQAGDSLAYIVAKNAVDLGKLSLALLLQLENPAVFDIEIPAITLTPPVILSEQSSESVYNTALENQASVKSAQYSILSAERRWRASQGLYYPTLGFFYDLRTNYSSLGQRAIDNAFDTRLIGFVDDANLSPVRTIVPIFEGSEFPTQYKDNVYHSLGFGLDVPIFNNLRTRTAVKNAELQYLRAKYSFKGAQDQLKSDVYVAYADVKAAWQKYQASQNSARALEKSFEYVTKRFNLGAANTLEYSTSSTSLAAAQNEMIKAKYDYILKLKVLDFYLGNAITLN